MRGGSDRMSCCAEGADPLLRQKIVGELALLVVLANGHLYYIDEPLVPLRYHRKFQAIGSGLEYATGAMAMGADAKEAVRVAIKFDSDSGGRIHTMKPKLVAGKRPLRLKV
jgi:ATP-dependent protease HslVU (ClpYQ) peptidase subunit